MYLTIAIFFAMIVNINLAAADSAIDALNAGLEHIQDSDIETPFSKVVKDSMSALGSSSLVAHIEVGNLFSYTVSEFNVVLLDDKGSKYSSDKGGRGFLRDTVADFHLLPAGTYYLEVSAYEKNINKYSQESKVGPIHIKDSTITDCNINVQAKSISCFDRIY